MKRSSTFFLQFVIALIGVAALAFLLWEPHLEGRNAHATVGQVYFNDPFLAFAYLGSVPFFVALYQAFKTLGYVRQGKVFSPEAVSAMRTMKYCAIALIGFVAIGEVFIMSATGEDRAGGVFMGILIAFGAIVIGAAATMFEGVLQHALELKSARDLAV